LVDSKWKDGVPFYKDSSETTGNLEVQDVAGIICPLRKLEPWQVERTLGIWLAPDGNMDVQFAWMKEKAESWANKIRSRHLPRHLTWMAWTTTILKTLEYPLPVMTLSRKQCDKITSILANTALPRCGFMRYFPRALLHAPVAVGGLNIPNLYTEQGIGHIIRLIHYSQSRNHSTGKLLRFTCEAFKLQMGCNGNIFSFPTMLSTLATNSWIKSTWEFAQENQIAIMDDIPDMQCLRIGDRLIIPTLATLGFSAP
jgi:hypothetical protein